MKIQMLVNTIQIFTTRVYRTHNGWEHSIYKKCLKIPKAVIRILKSKNRQQNGQNKNDLQITIQKSKDRATRISLSMQYKDIHWPLSQLWILHVYMTAYFQQLCQHFTLVDIYIPGLMFYRWMNSFLPNVFKMLWKWLISFISSPQICLIVDVLCKAGMGCDFIMS